jgi:hypothetical protein
VQRHSVLGSRVQLQQYERFSPMLVVTVQGRRSVLQVIRSLNQCCRIPRHCQLDWAQRWEIGFLSQDSGTDTKLPPRTVMLE